MKTALFDRPSEGTDAPFDEAETNLYISCRSSSIFHGSYTVDYNCAIAVIISRQITNSAEIFDKISGRTKGSNDFLFSATSEPISTQHS